MNDTLLQILTELQHCRVRPDAGICGNVIYALTGMNIPYKERQKTIQDMHAIMHKWPEATGGDPRYPVEGEGYKYVYSMRNETLWRDERRYALLRWMIKELENESRLRTDLQPD